MPQFWDSINPELQAWTLKQSLFFTASAPLTGAHINVSPKGLPSTTFSIFSPNQAAYIDATGSGVETISHIYENGRVTIMFCSFEASPRIIRFFCTGRVVEWDTPEFEPLIAKMGKKRIEGARAVILLDVFKVQSSCGYAVPKLALCPSKIEGDEEKLIAGFEDRNTLGHWASKMVAKDELCAYQKKNNSRSLDGVSGMKIARKDAGEILWLYDLKDWCRRILKQSEAMSVGFVLALVLVFGVRALQALLSEFTGFNM